MSAHARSSPCVIFHADDFGMNAAVNAGILVSFREGLLTSTSLLANAPAAKDALDDWPDLIRDQQSGSLASQVTRQELSDPILPFDLGIHLNLTQGKPLTAHRFPTILLDSNGSFPGIGSIFSRLRKVDQKLLPLVMAELEAQIEWMCDSGFRPTHLNGHQYIELIPQVSRMIPELLRRYSIPVVRVARETRLIKTVLRHGRVSAWVLALIKRFFAGRFRRQMRNATAAFPDRFFGTAHAGLVTLEILSDYLDNMSRFRWIEIGLHPGEDPVGSQISQTDSWFDPLGGLRKNEREWLCCAELRDLLARRKMKLGRLKAITNRTH